MAAIWHPVTLRSRRVVRIVAVCAALALLASGAAHAAGAGKAADPAVVFIAELIALLLCGRLLGEAMQRVGQPAVMGQLIAGILLGPSVLGVLWPDAQLWLFPDSRVQKSMIDAVAQLGILLLLLLTGMETDLSLANRVRRAALGVSVAGIAVPFACGFVLGEFIPDAMLPDPGRRLVTALFLGVALSISSVKIVAMVVRDMNFMRRNVGQIIVASAIIDDTIGWIVMAVVFGLAEHGRVDPASVGASVLGTAIFLAASFTLGRRAVFLIIRWVNDNFVSEVPVITAVLLVMATLALITHFIGVHTVLGAFVAGILVGQSPILTRHIEAQLRGLITALFAPVFFGLAGLGTDIGLLANPGLIGLSLGLIAIASFGKFAGAFAGGMTGGLSRAESLAIAAGMNARGSTEVIIATIGLSMGVLSQNLFTMIVIMAIATTMAMPPMLRWALARLPMGEEEKQRLDREAFEAKGFVTNMERLLVAVDASASGKLASRLAGLIAGSRGMPLTVLHLDGQSLPGAPGEPRDTAALVKSSAQTAGDNAPEAAAVDVTTRRQSGLVGDAVTGETRKGYDFLFAGIEPALDAADALSETVAQAINGAEGPFGIVIARGDAAANPAGAVFNILLPVTGTPQSLRGAEVALALAKAANARLTALYVDESARRRLKLADGAGEGVLHGLVALADRTGIDIRTKVRSIGTAQNSILTHARRGRFNLIVMGVTRRTGEELHFGQVAAAILANSEASILFVAS